MNKERDTKGRRKEEDYEIILGNTEFISIVCHDINIY